MRCSGARVPYPAILELAYESLSRLPLAGKAAQPEHCETAGSPRVQLHVERSPNLTATLIVECMDDRVKIWAEVQSESGSHSEMSRLVEDLFSAATVLNKRFSSWA